MYLPANTTNMSMFEPDVGEPALTYWRPKPQTAVVSAPTPLSNSYHAPPGFCYPITDVVHSFVQNQQIGLSELTGQEREQRRMPQIAYGQLDPRVLMSALSTASYMDQNSQQTVTDSLIQDEITRAAKTLFSKRNRFLMHWLNPNMSKSQLKIDFDAAWNSLPPTEKVFYISQVLGKFAPHTTSLMVNPHLEVKQSNSVRGKTGREDIDDHTNISNDSGCASELTKVTNSSTPEPKISKTRARSKTTKKSPQKRQMEYCSDEASCDSGLAMDQVDIIETPRVKRKYTKRQHKSPTSGSTTCETKNENLSCAVPEDINKIKVEPYMEAVPKVKRKYIKRKLERKKYKKREQKNKQDSNCVSNPVVTCQQPSIEPLQQDSLTSEDMDLWIEIDNNNLPEDIFLLNEEVDSFWETIGDPSNLFMDLEIK